MTRLGELAELRMGGTPSRAEPSFWAEGQSGHAWIAISDLGGKFLSKTAETVTSLGARSARLQLIPSGIPVMSFKLSIGKASIPLIPVYTNEAIVALLPKSGKADALWLYHTAPVVAKNAVTETAVKGQTLNLSKLNNLLIPTPGIAEQKGIAEILDCADNSIESSMALIAKLKVNNSGLGRDLLNRIDTPARPLASFLSTRPRNGFSPNEVESWTGTVALGLGCLTPDGFAPRQLKNVPARDPRYAGAWLSDGDLLISRSNTFELVGLVGRYRDVGTPCVYPDLMMRLVPNKLVRPEFLELALRNVAAREQIKRMSQGTSGSMVKVSASGIMKLMVKIPGLPEQDRLLSIYAAEKALQEAEERAIAKLRLLKQGLMDDLLTGRVRVPVG